MAWHGMAWKIDSTIAALADVRLSQPSAVMPHFGLRSACSHDVPRTKTNAFVNVLARGSQCYKPRSTPGFYGAAGVILAMT